MKGMAIYPGDARYRKYCVDAMETLLAKCGEGYEAWAKERGEIPAPPPAQKSSPPQPTLENTVPAETKNLAENIVVTEVAPLLT
jgi:hypothetical protein